jgi:ferredoxin
MPGRDVGRERADGERSRVGACPHTGATLAIGARHSPVAHHAWQHAVRGAGALLDLAPLDDEWRVHTVGHQEGERRQDTIADLHIADGWRIDGECGIDPGCFTWVECHAFDEIWACVEVEIFAADRRGRVHLRERESPTEPCQRHGTCAAVCPVDLLAALAVGSP